MTMGLDSFLAASTITVSDCVPVTLVGPVVGGLVTALVYQTKRLGRMTDKTEQLVAKLLDEVIDGKHSAQLPTDNGSTTHAAG